MFVIAPEGPARARPALVTGYGGFGISREPAYTPQALAWVAAGGVYALVSLRGGGEEGEDWHLAGNRANKQNVFDDLHAAAAALIDAGRHHGRIARDHGRLQRRACSSGQRSPSGRSSTGPWSARPRCWTWCATRSSRSAAPGTTSTAPPPTRRSWAGCCPTRPTTTSGPGVAYPAVLFTVFDSDTRVDPLHARKMCAALQHATTGDPLTRPVLLRRETDVGHGARSVSRTVALATDQLAFLAAHTGLELP